MDTQTIKAASIISKKNKGVRVKIWTTELPQRTDELDEWYLTGKIYEFKDDLQGGKFMWISSFVYQNSSHNGMGYYDTMTTTGVFLNDDYIQLIGFENDKVYLKDLTKETLSLTFKYSEEDVDHTGLKPNNTETKTSSDIEDPAKTKESITLTRKLLWKYVVFSFLMGLLIGVCNGIALAAYFIFS